MAKVSDTSFGDAFIHTILRDEREEYLAVIGKHNIQVFALDGTEIDVTFGHDSHAYLHSVTDAKKDLRAVTVADYTFISNTKMLTAMDPAVAPKAPRPDPHECLVWVKQAVYGNEYTLNLNGYKTSVQTPVSAVKSIGTSVIEYRISSEDIADALRRGFEGGSVTHRRDGASKSRHLRRHEGCRCSVWPRWGRWPAGSDHGRPKWRNDHSASSVAAVAGRKET